MPALATLHEEPLGRRAVGAGEAGHGRRRSSARRPARRRPARGRCPWGCRSVRMKSHARAAADDRQLGLGRDRLAPSKKPLATSDTVPSPPTAITSRRPVAQRPRGSARWRARAASVSRASASMPRSSRARRAISGQRLGGARRWRRPGSRSSPRHVTLGSSTAATSASRIMRSTAGGQLVVGDADELARRGPGRTPSEGTPSDTAAAPPIVNSTAASISTASTPRAAQRLCRSGSGS